MKINDYRDLKVWQLAMEVAEQVYQLCGTFPQHQQFTLVSQMQRASISVPSNIAEGTSDTPPRIFASASHRARIARRVGNSA
jgi:four helix bundle protein